MSNGPTTLLIVPDQAERSRLTEILEQHGQVVLAAESGAEAQGRLPPSGSELVIVLDLSGSDALDYLNLPPSARGSAPVVCLADRRQATRSAEALRLGVADMIGRPTREHDLLAALANAREFAGTPWPAPAAAPAAATPDEALFGSSEAMRDVLAIVGQVAQSRCAVVITGEPGSGRQTVAREIHHQSRSREASFVRIACAGADGDALKRLFSGDWPAGSTIYLEDLHELARPEQRRLAAHIGGAPVGPPAGSATPTASRDLRFIGSAAARTLDPSERQALSGELIDAIAVVRIDLPPLRQRAEDIPLLAMHFLKEACRRHERPAKVFARSALMLLGALPWRGNAAELRALAERLSVLVPRGTVLLEDVLANVRFDGVRAMGESSNTLRIAREEFEREYIAAVLRVHHGRMAAAARELGIERTNLYRKIKQLNISWTAELD